MSHFQAIFVLSVRAYRQFGGTCSGSSGGGLGQGGDSTKSWWRVPGSGTMPEIAQTSLSGFSTSLIPHGGVSVGFIELVLPVAFVSSRNFGQRPKVLYDFAKVRPKTDHQEKFPFHCLPCWFFPTLCRSISPDVQDQCGLDVSCNPTSGVPILLWPWSPTGTPAKASGGSWEGKSGNLSLVSFSVPWLSPVPPIALSSLAAAVSPSTV